MLENMQHLVNNYCVDFKYYLELLRIATENFLKSILSKCEFYGYK